MSDENRPVGHAPRLTRPRARLLSGRLLDAATAWAQARPLEQSLLLADLTQLAGDSLAAGVFQGSRLRGLACCYTGLPFLAVSIWSETPQVAAALLGALAAGQPRLRREPAYALVAAPICAQLIAAARVEETQEEVKRVLVPEAPAAPSLAVARWSPVQLGPRDLPALQDLYRDVPAMAWSPEALGYGPWRGVYDGNRLVAAAGVHFATPWVAELGHIVTRPAYRRQGLGEATIRALIGDLQGQTGHIFLMHFADNQAAGRLYGRLGFQPYERLYLTRFRPAGPAARF